MLGFDLDQPLVPADEIVQGGPAKDGIPSIDHPIFKPIADYTFFDDDTRVIGVVHAGVAKAYPIPILNWHEVVNDYFGEQPVVITYCPLCGSGMAFAAKINGQRTEFGVSGLLYNSDMLLYDRRTESLWSQLRMQAIAGPRKGEKLTMVATQHTTLGAWKKAHPESLILTTRTGHIRNYQQTPYGEYEDNRELYFTPQHTSDGYHPKEWVLGLEIEGHYKAYPFSELAAHPELEIPDTFRGQDLRINYDILHDTATITYDQGHPFPSVTAYWFAWYAFHPQTAMFRAE